MRDGGDFNIELSRFLNGEKRETFFRQCQGKENRDECEAEHDGHNAPKESRIGKLMRFLRFITQPPAVDGDLPHGFTKCANAADVAAVGPGKSALGKSEAVDRLAALGANVAGRGAQVVAAVG